MKPCREYKERVALSVMNANADGEIQQHLAGCSGCRAYAEEMWGVCRDHMERAATLPAVGAPTHFHSKLKAAIGSRSSGRESAQILGFEIAFPLRRLLQGLGVAGAVGCLAALILFASRKATPPDVVKAPAAPAVQSVAVSEPSFAAYHRRLAKSVEALEASLQASAPISDGELLKVSSGIAELP